MIRYALQCRKGHGFEAWFRDSAAYEAQVAAKELACPTCGSKKIEKQLMAPALSRSAEERKLAAAKQAELRRQLKELRQKVEENCDYVGNEFPEEARKIFYGETDARGIYGEASDDEVEELTEEGIEVGRIPWLPRENS